MAEVGRRFELAGRASVAGRWELAAFEAEEMEELFEGDLPRADPPKEGAADKLPGMAEAFLKTYPPALKKAAAAKDRAAFAEAFRSAAEMCNACHNASDHGFIEVPSTPGKAVPDIDPPQAPAAPR
jgi:cytochrome c553